MLKTWKAVAWEGEERAVEGGGRKGKGRVRKEGSKGGLMKNEKAQKGSSCRQGKSSQKRLLPDFNFQ